MDEYEYDITLDNKYNYIDTIYQNNHWIPVVGRIATIGDEVFFVFVVDKGNTREAHIMRLLGQGVMFSFGFTDFNDLSQKVVDTLADYKIDQLTGSLEFFEPRFDNIPPKPPLVKKTNAEMNSPETQKALKQFRDIQHKYADFEQSL